jgi:hypothetical protein
MNKYLTPILFFVFLSSVSFSQDIILQPVQGKMVCGLQVPGLNRQTFALGIPETIGSSEGMILNFPEVTISWFGPDKDGIVSHSWKTAGKIEYSVKLIPHEDYIDLEMTIKNLSNNGWTSVFSFNCLNPVNAPQFQDWSLERTYMSKDGKPFRMDGTTRINTGEMKTVQFYLHKDYKRVSPFVNGFGAISPDRTDDSYIVTMSEDGGSYMAATSPSSLFLFDNLDRCCIHSATDFGDIPRGGEKTVTSRFYLAKGALDDFLKRFESEVKNVTKPRVAMCWSKPWELADTAKWNFVFNNIDIYKFYIGNIDLTALPRLNRDTVKQFVSALIKKDIKIAIELGGLLDWHASKGNMAGESSFQQDWANLQEFIKIIKEIDPNRNIDILDMDGPIRRMLFPNNKKENYHTIESAVDELFEVVKWWKDSIPTIEINLLTNFPNWAWGDTPAYFAISGEKNGYGYYIDVLNAIAEKYHETGIKIDGLTIDNPYDYATGKAQTNQPDEIEGVDWMKRIAELAEPAKAMGLKVNMIFNTNGGRTAQGYAEQTLSLIDLYHQKVGIPDGYWIQSWYQLPDKWLPETEDFTMTNLTKKVLEKLGRTDVSSLLPEKVSLLFPEDQIEVTSDELSFVWQRSKPDITNYNLDIYIGRAIIFSDATLPDTSFTYKYLNPNNEYTWRVRAKNKDGWGEWSDLWTFYSKVATSVSEISSNKESMSISPNPASEYIEISSHSIKRGLGGVSDEIKIYNTFGECLVNYELPVTKYNEKIRIDVSHLQSGVYFIMNGEYLEKVIIVK